jgi:DNA polymerase III delta prime subunit
VNGQDSKAEIFDVFLCHNSKDKPAVREIAQMLVKKGIKPWLDEDQIRPGSSWQTALGQQIESIESAAVFVSDEGLGPWQDQEIQSFLNRFVSRRCAVVPVILPTAKETPELPWPFENLHRVDFRTNSQPLERLIWGITGKKPAELVDVLASDGPAIIQEAVKPRLIEGRHGQAPEEKVPPLPNAPDPDNASQLNILRRRVMEYWVDGVLKHSLYNEVLISLDRRDVPDAIDAPWKYTVEVSDDGISSGPLDDRDVSVIYDTTGLLLILGEPGSGKTTTLLELAQTLFERARQDIKERVPVVLNLSSWKKKQPLAEWISIELSEKYRVPRKIARFWLQQGYLLPLLDGLDEIETVMQPDCVSAINAFIEEFKPSGLVVCCRLNEYRWLPKRLKLNGAIRIEPLSPEEVNKYLVAAGSRLAALREAVDTDPVLQELAQTPLMLSIMSLAYQGACSNEFATQQGDSPEERRKQIFGFYIEQMFQRKGTGSLVFPKDKMIGWLSWLAGKMREHSQSIFLVEGLQPSWLSTKDERVAYEHAAVLYVSLIFGLSTGLGFVLIVGLSGGLFGVLLGGLIGGLFGGLTGVRFVRLLGLNQITLVETLSWRWDWTMTIVFSISVGIISLGAWLIISLGLWLILGVLLKLSVSVEIFRPSFILPLSLSCGLFGGFFCGFRGRVKVGKTFPNQGIKLSLINSLTVVLVTWLIAGLIMLSFWLSLWLDTGRGMSLALVIGRGMSLALVIGRGMSLALVIGMIAGLLHGLVRGSFTVIKHYALRLTLWRNAYMPLNLIKLLDHCARLILLKKVGGGYIFIHRMLLEYFAEMTPQSTRAEAGKAGLVGSVSL